uniref:ORF3 n=1 Tax=Chuvivirus sp. TaxID=2948592 RepID=A0A9Y1CSE8_9VIRU|nr:ORF3 [Chuvivirus sp.]
MAQVTESVKALVGTIMAATVSETAVESDHSLGYLDKDVVWKLYLEERKLSKNFGLRNINHTPFVTDVPSDVNSVNRLFRLGFTYAYMRVYVEEKAALTNDVLASAGSVAIGELLSPKMPDSRVLKQAEARKYFTTTVREFFKCAEQSGGPLQASDPVSYYRGHFTPVQLQNFPSDDAFKAGLVSGNLIGNDLPVAIALLSIYSTVQTASYDLLGPQLLTHTVLAFLKTGMTTAQFRTKITNGLREFWPAFTVQDSLIVATHKLLASTISRDTISFIVDHWKTVIPETAIVLRNMLSHCAWHNLTGYQTIVRTIIALPAFPWLKLITKCNLESDFGRFLAAVEYIKNDPYAGYETDTTRLHGVRQYKQLATTAAYVAEVVGGDENIRKAVSVAGQISMPIRKFVDDYMVLSNTADEPSDVLLNKFRKLTNHLKHFDEPGNRWDDDNDDDDDGHRGDGMAHARQPVTEQSGRPAPSRHDVPGTSSSLPSASGPSH